MSGTLATLGSLVLATSSIAQPQPQPGSGDPRIQLVDFRPDQVVRLEAAVGYQVVVELAPDEQIQTVAVGDTAAWQVAANKAGDRLFVKPTQAGGPTNMAIITSARSYNFELAVGGGSAAYTVRFRYPPEIPPQPLSSGAIAGNYRMSGDRRLWPDGIRDDGAKTFIDWSADAAMPAVYVIDSLGREVLANGNMRDETFVIDGVEQNLVFRIDRHVARASRYIAKKRKS